MTPERHLLRRPGGTASSAEIRGQLKGNLRLLTGGRKG